MMMFKDQPEAPFVFQHIDAEGATHTVRWGSSRKGMSFVTVEDMINEGSLTPLQAQQMGLKWEAVVTGGDALEIRKAWLRKQQD